MSNADDFNENEWDEGRLKPAHVSELVARFQREQGLAVDGMAGVKTRAMIELLRGREPAPTSPGPGPAAAAPRLRANPMVAAISTSALGDLRDLAPLTIDQGWLVGAGVTRIPIHQSWFYSKLETPSGRPRAIVAHYTATDPGTAVTMFKARQDKIDTDPNDGDGVDRQASWHVSIETDGRIYQGADFLRGCWHAGGPTAKSIPNVGRANRVAVGIELVGRGDVFPEEQVIAAARVWKVIADRYQIPRELAMVTHAELDPSRKRDPGPVFMSAHAPRVLRYIFGD